MRFLFLTLAGLIGLSALSQLSAQTFHMPKVYGMYGQWGYNRDRFSRSDIRFRGEDYDFTIHDARAHDKPDFSGFRDAPLDITIPQNSFRVGLYLNPARTHGFEINFDHAKYVMESNQRARLTGTIYGERIDVDTIIRPEFVSFEHTNGANLLLFAYMSQHPIWQAKRRTMATVIWKVGAGVPIPKSDVRLFNVELDNRYHIAGYLAAAEAGTRFYISRRLFAEATVKGGWANYRDVLTVGTGRARHQFWFGEVLAFVGYDLPFRRGGFGKVGEGMGEKQPEP